jgi:hypothetical protein
MVCSFVLLRRCNDVPRDGGKSCSGEHAVMVGLDASGCRGHRERSAMVVLGVGGRDSYRVRLLVEV